MPTLRIIVLRQLPKRLVQARHPVAKPGIQHRLKIRVLPRQVGVLDLTTGIVTVAVINLGGGLGVLAGVGVQPGEGAATACVSPNSVSVIECMFYFVFMVPLSQSSI